MGLFEGSASIESKTQIDSYNTQNINAASTEEMCVSMDFLYHKSSSLGS